MEEATNSGSLPKSVDVHPDMMTLEQLESIKKEIAAEQPMIGPLESLDRLLLIYADSLSIGFIPGIRFLSSKFSGMRRIRGDGNCFYRALLFGYLDNLLRLLKSDDNSIQSEAAREHERILAKIKGSMEDLVAVGYSEFTIEIFYDELIEVISGLKDQTTDSLLEMFQEGGKADYITWYMRALTAGYLKKDVDRFLPFVEGLHVDMDSFCKYEVEPMDKECEHIQIIALTEYLGVKIVIAYLDGRAFDEADGLSFVTFPDQTADVQPSDLFKVELLYRPGHYDLLYHR